MVGGGRFWGAEAAHNVQKNSSIPMRARFFSRKQKFACFGDLPTMTTNPPVVPTNAVRVVQSGGQWKLKVIIGRYLPMQFL